jgi:hypothetical protein
METVRPTKTRLQKALADLRRHDFDSDLSGRDNLLQGLPPSRPVACKTPLTTASVAYLFVDATNKFDPGLRRVAAQREERKQCVA